MNDSRYNVRSPLARPFRSRSANWVRDTVKERSVVRLDGGVLLRRFVFPAPIPAAAGRRLAFVSDLHYHATLSEERRVDALAAALSGAGADLLLLGGDAAGDACHLKGLAPVLRRLSKCAPVSLAVPGNWERGKRWLELDFWRSIYGDGGFELLCNESRETGAFFVYGGDDLVHGCPEPPPKRGGEGKLRILLNHRPDAVISFDSGDTLAGWHFALCGHTHGGQWRLPWLGALFVPGFYRRRFDRGWFRRPGGAPRMFVGAGLGELSLPGRFNCPREAALIEFASSSEV